jgi:beta-galactosidase
MRRTISLDDNWGFHKGDIAMDQVEKIRWETVVIPHTWNNLDGQDGGNDYYQGKAWYRKILDKNVIPKDLSRDIYIRFGAASKRAFVYLNKELIGCHDGGFSAFTLCLTGKLTGDGDELLVMVDNSRDLPIYPMQADFTFFGGIYRDVDLICFDTTEHFKVDEYGKDALLVTPSVDGNINIRTKMQGTNKDSSFILEVYELDGESKNLVAQKSGFELKENNNGWLEGNIALDGVRLWDGVDDPALYSMKLSCLSKDALKENDELSTCFGFRDFSVDAEEGFFLNRRSYPLHGVCRHQDREDMGWAITKKEHDEDMNLIREIGANTIRLAHYQQDAYFYDLCDKNGMVVWAEIPFISVYDSRKEADENLRIQMKELIMQNYNHPSICFWGIANETGIGGECQGMYDILSELNAITKELDGTRLTTMANFGGTGTDSPLFHSTDVATYNEYMGWYEGSADDHGSFADEKHKELGTVPLGISEYGAEAVMKWHSAEPKVKDYTEEYQAIVHEKAITAFRKRKYLLGTWLWNMFDFAADARDEGGCRGRNNKGLVTYDRKTKKQAFYLYKALWSREPFVYLCGERFTKRHEDRIEIKVYSNVKEIQLYADGELFGTQGGEAVFVFENVPVSKEYVSLEARGVLDDGTTVSSGCLVIEKVQSMPDEYVLKEEKNLSEAVTQWFAGIADYNENSVKEIVVREGYLSVNDPLEEVYKYKEGYDVIQEMVAKPMSLVNPGMADRMKTGGAMSFASIWNHISKMFPDDLIYAVNERLNKIKK